MKQYTTEEQFNKLSEKGKNTIRKWMVDHKYNLGICENPDMNIGQMIEFLDEYNSYKDDDGDTYIDYIGYVSGIRAKTLCDDLWEAVKEVLEKK